MAEILKLENKSNNLFFIDKNPSFPTENPLLSLNDSHISIEPQNNNNNSLWYDSDDENVNVNINNISRLKKLKTHEKETFIKGSVYEKRLRSQFEKLHPKPQWASLLEKRKLNRKDKKTKKVDDDDKYGTDDTDDDIDNENVLNTLNSFDISKKKDSSSDSKALLPHTINISRCRDVNTDARSKAVIQTLSFHPHQDLLLVGGFDKTLRLFKVHEKNSSLAQSVHFDNLPIHTAKFTSNGNQIIISGRRKHYYMYDLEIGNIQRIPGIPGVFENSFERFFLSPDGNFIAFTGNHGYIHLVSQETKQLVTSIKMNHSVRSLDFSPDARYLYSVGEDHEIYIWDLKMSYRCLNKIVDEGGLKSSTLVSSHSGEYLACGSDSGVLNIYSTSLLHQSSYNTSVKPLKSLMNLTTYINHAKFNHDSQLLGYCSRSKKNSFRLVHLPSLSVYANWPTSRVHLNYVNSFDVSSDSRFIATGNDQGKVQLFRLNDFSPRNL